MTTITIIRKSTTSTTGYELVVIENGTENVMPIEKALPTKKGDDLSLVLPENPSNRKYFTVKKVEEAGGEVELTFKATNPTGPRHKKSLEEYMTPEELELQSQYERMLEAVAERRRADEEAQKTEKPKAKTKAELQAEVEALMAQLAAMKGEA